MILNAKITSADIFIEDHDVLTFSIGIETSAGWSTSIGNIYLDWQDDTLKRVPATYMAVVIRAILETVGVRSWSDLVGKYIRIDDNDLHNSPVTKLANLMKENWINIRDIVEVDVCV